MNYSDKINFINTHKRSGDQSRIARKHKKWVMHLNAVIMGNSNMTRMWEPIIDDLYKVAVKNEKNYGQATAQNGKAG